MGGRVDEDVPSEPWKVMEDLLLRFQTSRVMRVGPQE
jgi:hypothetical protein